MPVLRQLNRIKRSWLSIGGRRVRTSTRSKRVVCVARNAFFVAHEHNGHERSGFSHALAHDPPPRPPQNKTTKPAIFSEFLFHPKLGPLLRLIIENATCSAIAPHKNHSNARIQRATSPPHF